jgi:hypothetical protein
MDGTVRVELVGATRNPDPTFAPPAFTALPTVTRRQAATRHD